MNSAIDVRDLTVRYGAVLALEGVAADFRRGALTAIIGPNGAGKSTLLKALIGAVGFEGTVAVHGEKGRARLKHIAYVPQRREIDADFPVTVRDVVTQGVYPSAGWFGRLRREHRDRIAEALEATGVTALADRPIGALSGGQQQRAFLARALAQQGSVVLLDEPFAGIDATTEAALVAVLASLRDRGATVVVVHHDLSTVRTIFDDVVLLSTRVVASGTVEAAFTAENVQRTYGSQIAMFERDGGAVTIGATS